MAQRLILLVSAMALLDTGDLRGENPLFRELTMTGIRVGSQDALKLPLPTLADGADGPAQLAAIEKLNPSLPLDELLRPSVVAPLVLKMESIAGADNRREAQRISLWFVAHGRLQTIRNEKLLRELADTAARTQSTKTFAAELTPQELAKRNLILQRSDETLEWFVKFRGGLLDKVEVSGIANVMESGTTESSLVCAVLDPRFAADPELPNQWRPIRQSPDGELMVGAAVPYAGYGGYIKATALKTPASALLVECHAMFSEPLEWFGGANLLRSKLPLVVQDQVRTFRRKLAQAERTAAP